MRFLLPNLVKYHMFTITIIFVNNNNKNFTLSRQKGSEVVF